MIYVEHTPTEPLKKFVEKIWYCKANNLTSSCLTIPLLNPELVFNFSSGYKISGANADLKIRNTTAWISGIQVKGYFSCSEGQHEMLGVLFRTNGLKAFVKNHSSEFTQNFVPADLVFGNRLEALVNRLQSAASVQSKIAATEAFLLDHLCNHDYPAYLTYAFKYLSTAFGKGSVGALCKELSISNKSLIKTFQRHVGINPNKFIQLKAINNAVILLSKNPRHLLTKAAYELNFSDQSHFIHLFKDVTTLTPSEYCHMVRNKKADALSPNFLFQ